MSDDVDYDDPDVAAQWLSDQRRHVLEYLGEQSVVHAGVAERPDWYVAPYVAVWTVNSVRSPGVAGWWVISGDLPTDYLSGGEARDARGAVSAFSARWREIAARMLGGERHPTMTVGRPEDALELGDLLQRRAELLADFASDAELW